MKVLKKILFLKFPFDVQNQIIYEQEIFVPEDYFNLWHIVSNFIYIIFQVISVALNSILCYITINSTTFTINYINSIHVKNSGKSWYVLEPLIYILSVSFVWFLFSLHCHINVFSCSMVLTKFTSPFHFQLMQHFFRFSWK